MQGDVVHFGVLGTAQIALNQLIPAARESANSEVVAICSRTSEKARAAAEEHGIPNWYGSYDELLADANVDAVVNPLPNSMHCEWTIKAAEAGKHVLCEKPLAVTMDEARRMIAAAQANQVILIEAFPHRWNPHLRTARKRILAGAIGHVTGLHSALTSIGGEPQHNIRFKPELAGGSLMAAGCYAVYACRFVLGEEPLRASGFAYDSGGYGVDTSFSGLLEFPGGATAHVASSFEQHRRCELIAVGSEGRIEIPDMFDDSGPSNRQDRRRGACRSGGCPQPVPGTVRRVLRVCGYRKTPRVPGRGCPRQYGRAGRAAEGGEGRHGRGCGADRVDLPGVGADRRNPCEQPGNRTISTSLPSRLSSTKYCSLWPIGHLTSSSPCISRTGVSTWSA